MQIFKQVYVSTYDGIKFSYIVFQGISHRSYLVFLPGDGSNYTAWYHIF
jgi:hypothetical protein